MEDDGCWKAMIFQAMMEDHGGWKMMVRQKPVEFGGWG